MDAKQILEKQKDLQKATSQGAGTDHILKILDDLKTGVKASEDLLRSTKVGIVMNRFKNHKDPRIARLATDAIKKWREDIQKQSGRASPASDKKGTASPQPVNGTKAKPEVALDQRNYKKDGVSITKTNQDTRDNCIGLLYNGLCYMSPDTSDAILTVAIAVEAAGFAKFESESSPAYTNKMRSLYLNLKNKTSAQLRKHVLSGIITPERLVNMSSEELKSEERRVADKSLMEVNMKDASMPKPERSISSAIHCSNPKCGKNTVAYSQAQTRSADEPMTTFCECELTTYFLVEISALTNVIRSILWQALEGKCTSGALSPRLSN